MGTCDPRWPRADTSQHPLPPSLPGSPWSAKGDLYGYREAASRVLAPGNGAGDPGQANPHTLFLWLQ